MLILSRRVGESIVIGDEVYLTVLGLHGKQIKLGFDAPHGVSVHRLEIHQRLQGGPLLKRKSASVSTAQALPEVWH